MTGVETFTDTSLEPAVRGFLDSPGPGPLDTLILAHGAGGNARMSLLAGLGEAFSGAGFRVLRADLPFRQLRPFGPPRPAEAARDRRGLKNAVSAMRKLGARRIFLGGQSYGGRQASMLCAEETEELADGLLLLSYPLHPPARGGSSRARTEHFGEIRVPVLFVQGARDPFATTEEIEAARRLIGAKTRLFTVPGAGHDLGFRGLGLKGKAGPKDLPAALLKEWSEFLG